MSKGGMWLALSLLTVIFALPATFQFTPPSIAIEDFHITYVEICILVLLAWSVFGAVSARRWVVTRSPFDGPMLILLATLVVSLVLGVSRYGATKALGDARQYLPLGLYFWCTRTLARPDQLEAVRRRLLLVLAFVASYVLIAFAFFRAALNSYAEANGANVALMEDRVFFGNTLLVLFFYGGYLLDGAIGVKRSRLLVLAVLMANIAMLLVMQVRTFWIAFAVVIVMTVWAQRGMLLRQQTVAKALLWAPLCAALVVTACVVDIGAESWSNAKTSISERVGSLLDFKETFVDRTATTKTDVETLGTRWRTAQVVIDEYILPNPIFGIALGGELPLVDGTGTVVSAGYMMDNGYLTILAKFGLVGCALYGWVLFRLVRCLRRVARAREASDEERRLARSLVTGIVASLIASTCSSVPVREQTAIIAFLLVLAETTVLRTGIHARRRLVAQVESA